MPSNPSFFSKRGTALVFVLSWILLFLLYLPAQQAGFVGDYFKDWLQVIQQETFWNYIHRPGTSTLYHFTQFVTWIIYQVIGSSRTGWHLVHISMHAVNCALLFHFVRHLLLDAQLKPALSIAAATTFLFMVSPYNAEVIVHEPCLHYALGFCMLLMSLLWLQRYFTTRKTRYLIFIVVLYLPASFSLEVFYLTPWVLLLLAAFYRSIGPGDLKAFWRFGFLAFLPMLLIFALHILLVQQIVHTALPHQTPSAPADLFTLYNSKVVKYVFHMLLLGRFFPAELKDQLYHLLGTTQASIVFHVIVFALFLAVGFWKGFSVRWKLLAALVPMILLFLALVTTREFPQMQWVVFDRYLYFALPFTFLAIAVIFTAAHSKLPSLLAFSVYSLVSIYFLRVVNLAWRDSDKVVQRLLDSFPVSNDKTTLLLNLPENYKGILMIGSARSSALKTAYNTKHENKITAPVHDMASYNLNEMQDGAHVLVVNDSTLKVTLNQWGTWWWFHYVGASSFDHEDFRLTMTDPGHWYELVLKKPAAHYQLLFVNDGSWRKVDMSKKGQDQY